MNEWISQAAVEIPSSHACLHPELPLKRKRRVTGNLPTQTDSVCQPPGRYFFFICLSSPFPSSLLLPFPPSSSLFRSLLVKWNGSYQPFCGWYIQGDTPLSFGCPQEDWLICVEQSMAQLLHVLSPNLLPQCHSGRRITLVVCQALCCARHLSVNTPKANTTSQRKQGLWKVEIPGSRCREELCFTSLWNLSHIYWLTHFERSPISSHLQVTKCLLYAEPCGEQMFKRRWSPWAWGAPKESSGEDTEAYKGERDFLGKGFCIHKGYQFSIPWPCPWRRSQLRGLCLQCFRFSYQAWLSF